MPEERGFAEKRSIDPAAQRARALLLALGDREPSSVEIFEAFSELDALPVEEVREALATIAPLPDPDRLDTATRLRLGLPLRPLRLRVVSAAKDADVLDLGPVAEEQLRLAGKTWDGADLAPEERLDGEVEGSFAGTLERRVLVDADAPAEPLYDVMLFAEDSGVVFAAGTTKIVALIAYGKVELKDSRTRVALEEAIAAPAPATPAHAEPPSEPVVAASEPLVDEEPAPEPPPELPLEPPPAPRDEAPAKSVAKKTAVKKAAKKAAATKTAKKGAAKKAAATKSAKKTATTKKTAAPKKTATTKKSAKKTTTPARGAKKGAKKATARKKK